MSHLWQGEIAQKVGGKILENSKQFSPSHKVKGPTQN